MKKDQTDIMATEKLEGLSSPDIGHLDAVSRDGISGWAAPQNDSPTEVRISVEDIVFETVHCAEFRQDLADAGIAGGNAAFSSKAMAKAIHDISEYTGVAKIDVTRLSDGNSLNDSPAYIINKSIREMRRANIFTTTFFTTDGSHFYHGGAERYLLDLSLILSSLGLEVNIIQASTVGNWMTSYRGLKIRGVQTPTMAVSDISVALHAASEDAGINIYSPFTLASACVRQPSIGISHGVYWDCPGGEFDAGKNKTEVLSGILHTGQVVSVDTNTINFIRSHRPEFTKKMVYIPNYVDQSFFDTDEIPPRHLQEKLRKRRDKVICFPRRIYNARGFHFVEAVIPKILSIYRNIEFWLVGGISLEDRPRVDALTGRYPEQVRWFECQPEDMRHVYSRVDISLIPTLHSEGTSLSALEAMAAGNCVIATSVGGLTDIVIDDFNGLLIAPDADELFEAVKRALDDPRLRERLGEQARVFASRFSRERWMERWSQIIKKQCHDGETPMCNLKDTEPNSVIFLRTDGISWSHMKQRPQHLARAIGQLGGKVYFCSDMLEPPEAVEEAAAFGITIVQPGGEIHVNSAIAYTCYAYHAADIAEQLAGMDLDIRRGAHNPFKNIHASNIVLWFDVLDHPDIHQDDQYNVAASYCAKNAEILTYSSAPLGSWCDQHGNKPIFVPNAVFHRDFSQAASCAKKAPISLQDYVKSADLFSKVPVNLIMDRICVAYYGAIAEWTDISALNEVSDMHDVVLVMAGPIVESCQDFIKQLLRKKNVFHLGTLRYEELPSLLRNTDIGIAPFKITRMTDAVLPLKLLEYLAAGRPTIISDLAAVREFDLELGGVPGLHVYKTASDIPDLIRMISTSMGRPALTPIQAQRTSWMSSIRPLRDCIGLPRTAISGWCVISDPANAGYIWRRNESSISIDVRIATLDQLVVEIFFHNRELCLSELHIEASGEGVLYGGDLILNGALERSEICPPPSKQAVESVGSHSGWEEVSRGTVDDAANDTHHWLVTEVVKNSVHLLVPAETQAFRLTVHRDFQRGDGFLRLRVSIDEPRDMASVGTLPKLAP